MRWTPGDVSGDIEDRRGSSGPRFGSAPLGIGGMILLVSLSLIFKRDFVSMFSGTQQVAPTTNHASRSMVEDPAEAKTVQFVSFVLDDAQSTWDRLLPQEAGRTIPARKAGVVPGCDRFRLRHGASGHGTVLLSGGREGVYRPGLL